MITTAVMPVRPVGMAREHADSVSAALWIQSSFTPCCVVNLAKACVQANLSAKTVEHELGLI